MNSELGTTGPVVKIVWWAPSISVIRRAKFRQLPRICFNYFVCRFSLPLKYFLQGILDISLIAEHRIKVTRHPHEMTVRVDTGRMQFSISLLRHYFYLQNW